MNHISHYGKVILFTFIIVFAQSSHAQERQNHEQQVIIAQITDYCSKYSKAYLENYLQRSERASRLSDQEKYQLLGEIFSHCLSEKGSELKNDVGYNFQNEFFLY